MLSSIFPDTMQYSRPAILALADGSIFHGYAFGADGHAVAEVVFNTSMTGYQEILTDPSYFGQIVTLTYPHIGNTGVNPEDIESKGVQAAGLIARDSVSYMSNFRAQETLSEYLRQNNVVAIAGVDTRSLTRRIRDNGTQAGCILVGTDEQKALELARDYSLKANQMLAPQVSTDKNYAWSQGLWALGQGFDAAGSLDKHVVVVDFGVKQSILRQLVARGCQVTVVPAQTSAIAIQELNPDGVLLSNGPGNPALCTEGIETAQALIAAGVPVFGVCLGHQILGHALGAKSIKLTAGHHGSNHPVQELATNKVYITSQNHNYALDADSFTPDMVLTHRSLFDRSVQGFKHKTKPVFGFQGHPEANPGPRDIAALFDVFIDSMTPSQKA
ncbi:MAG TPA: glutamine-hydrolyzing carbamoyl-phosphate synthase small subunit [Paenalcaligenes sp.]|nr:glutamine-hydrolyzing carbamoyl-phosphate synthase small subunit [Paenalcaligenes sp.]